MYPAIFGIENDGLNLVVNLFVLMLVVVWLALIVWTYLDARRRIEDHVLVLCATAASLFPFIGTFVYSILRPPEFIEDAKERELEIRAAELRVKQLSEQSCPNCSFPVEKNFLRCPNCQRRLKDPCQSCGKPVDPRWALCPYCETALPGRARQRGRPEEGRRKPPPGAKSREGAAAGGGATPRKRQTRPPAEKPGPKAPAGAKAKRADGAKRSTAPRGAGGRRRPAASSDGEGGRTEERPAEPRES